MADITFVCAPIGGGKSLYATRAICMELERSERMIVTNVPIFDLEAPEGKMTLGEWAHKYVSFPVDIRKRFRLLTRDEVFEFWRYLPGKDLPNMERVTATRDTETVPDLQSRQGDGGCFFLIDEVHLYFSARDWGKNGVKVETYMSQLRKLNDDLFLITQHPEKVDKNFRRNATEWFYLKNMGKTKLWAGVSLPGRFRYHIFDQMPVRNDKPIQSGWMRLEDREYYRVYDTMAGVGLTGKLNPEQSRTKGRHWSVWVAAIVLIVVACFTLPRLAMYLFGRGAASLVTSVGKGVKSMVPNGVIPPPPNPLHASTETAPATTERPAVAAPSPIASRPVPMPEIPDEGSAMVGYACINGVWNVILSDGRTVMSTDPEFENLTTQGLKYAGHYYRRALVSNTQRAKEVAGSQAPVNIPHSAESSPLSAPSSPGPNIERRVNIHWPDGHVTQHSISSNSPRTPDENQ
jgi:Zonular occludens toxin (Zot)